MNILAVAQRACFLITLLGFVSGCSASENAGQGRLAPGGPESLASQSPTSAAPLFPTPVAANLSPEWLPLATRLQGDGLYGPDVEAALLTLGPVPSQDPMGRKIRELYTRAFVKPKPAPPADPNAPKVPYTPRPLVYKGVVTQDNVLLCQNYLAANKSAFDAAEVRFGVPRHIAVALMFVETRLGAFLGKENAFLTLASMSATTQAPQISQYVNALPGAEKNIDWIEERMRQRSDWAYKEFVALLEHVRASNANPTSIPGSIYGAIGLCQFMPSNLVPYGADGNNDGVVDLFTPEDAVASLSNYLVKHGWQAAAPRATHHKALKSYNRVDIYANTILAMGDAVSGMPIKEALDKTIPVRATPSKNTAKKPKPKPQQKEKKKV